MSRYGPTSERFMRHHYGASGFVPKASQSKERERNPSMSNISEMVVRDLIAKFRDLAVEMEKHSNDHIHDALPDNLAAAVEGVCADRINAILKPYKPNPA